MDMPSDGSLTVLFRDFCQGDARAAEALWSRFRIRLLRLVEKTLDGWPVHFVDAEDAVQSAFVSFWQSACRGNLGEDLHRQNIWNILGVMALRKAYRLIERERAQKRGGGRVIHESAMASHAHAQSGSPFDQVSSSVHDLDFDVFCEELLLQLDESLRSIALLKILGYTSREIADMRGWTERKVQRKVHLIRMTLEESVKE